MNKRGAMSGEEKILVALLAIFVLVIVIVGGLRFAGQQGGFFANLPFFGISKTNVSSIQLLRYDIRETKGSEVQYYDGNNWLNFKNGYAVLDEKKISSADLLNSFESYYYSTPRNVDIPNSGVSPVTFAIYDPSQGAIQMPGSPTLYAADVFIYSTTAVGKENYILRYDETLYNQSSDGSWAKINSNNYNQVINAAISWRDSVLKKPLKISYFDTKVELQDYIFVCPIKIGSYLDIDLTKPRLENADCTSK